MCYQSLLVFGGANRGGYSLANVSEAEANLGDEGRKAIARYLDDMIGQLETMASSANLELLAYLLAMAGAEAEAAKFDFGQDEDARFLKASGEVLMGLQSIR